MFDGSSAGRFVLRRQERDTAGIRLNTRLHSWFTLPRPDDSSIARGIMAPQTLEAYQSYSDYCGG
ncbi:hypothetical protein VCV18_006254 [Metarhizium anisopliae]